MKNYFATVLTGLEEVLLEEINTKLPATQINKIEKGKVFFSSNLSIDYLKTLKSADNLYQVITHFKVNKQRSSLQHLQKHVYDLYLKPFLGKGSFYVNVSRSGLHNYTRFEVAKKIMEGIKKRYPHRKIGTPRNHDIEFRLDIIDDDSLFSIRLTDATYRFRQKQRSFNKAALLPTVAHAMVWLSDPQAEDVFLDPCCGSGTILAERLAYPFTYIGGGDIDSEAINVAQDNLIDSLAEVNQWDARKLSFADTSIPKIVTNIPFGRQISFGSETNKINSEILTEIYRVLSYGGTAVILSEGWDNILPLANTLGFSLQKKYSLSLKGLHPTIYIFKK